MSSQTPRRCVCFTDSSVPRYSDQQLHTIMGAFKRNITTSSITKAEPFYQFKTNYIFLFATTDVFMLTHYYGYTTYSFHISCNISLKAVLYRSRGVCNECVCNVGNGCARSAGKARPWSVAGVNPDNNAAACTTGEISQHHIIACLYCHPSLIIHRGFHFTSIEHNVKYFKVSKISSKLYLIA